MADDDPTRYEERYCAFVDILGFRELMHELRTGAIEYTEIQDLLGRAYRQASMLTSNADLKVQSISDAIVMSARRNDLGLQDLILSIHQLTIGLLFRGYFLRGAIAVGRLFHNEKMVFGDALVRAYELESKVARFPRTIITSEVFNDIPYEFGGVRDGYVAQAADGPYFVDIFRQIRVAAEGNAQAETNRYRQIAEHIRTRLRQAADNPNHYEKVRWFAEHWNRALERCAPSMKKKLGVFAPGLSP